MTDKFEIAAFGVLFSFIAGLNRFGEEIKSFSEWSLNWFYDACVFLIVDWNGNAFLLCNDIDSNQDVNLDT